MSIVPEPVSLPHPALPGADWADRYAISSVGSQGTALEIAKRMLGRPPGWIRVLMVLRNHIVSLFGLKAADLGVAETTSVAGFPVVSQRDGQVVLGFNDSHLDFRIVVDVEPKGEAGNKVAVTTLVKRHNAFGWLYIAVITPFHRVIVRSTLGRLARG
nr:DUF2867 domain-containing protein [Rhizobium sp. ACO-34A]